MESDESSEAARAPKKLLRSPKQQNIFAAFGVAQPKQKKAKKSDKERCRCRFCGKDCVNPGGRTSHESFCKKKPDAPAEPSPKPHKPSRPLSRLLSVLRGKKKEGKEKVRETWVMRMKIRRGRGK
jgi:hypothetical protein